MLSILKDRSPLDILFVPSRRFRIGFDNDFARKIAEVMDLDAGLIKPIKSKDFKQPAKRPRDSSLNVDKIKRLNIRPSNIQQGLEDMRGES